MRKVKVEFAGRSFSLLTDQPDEIADRVVSIIQRTLSDLEKYIGDYTMEELLFLALANSVLERVKLEDKIEGLVKKLKEWSDEGGNV